MATKRRQNAIWEEDKWANSATTDQIACAEYGDRDRRPTEGPHSLAVTMVIRGKYFADYIREKRQSLH